jgi:methylated-DNA-protein-cysteine methyltransferase-like protein
VTTDAVSSYRRIYDVVRRIPRGRVATYGQVATLAGLPGRARLVGYALAALPERSVVPWHRVINAQGLLSLERVTVGGGIVQRQRLEREGVHFAGRRVPLTTYRWR